MTVPSPTGDLTVAPQEPAVNPAQPLTNPVTPPATPPVSKSDPEARINDLISQRDKKAREYEQAVAEKIAMQQQLELERQQRAAITTGAQTITEQASLRQRELEAALDKERAQATKLRLLIQYPELRNYEPLIPASSDEEVVKRAIAQALLAREQDIEAAKAAFAAAQPPATTTTPTPPIYPTNTYVPPMQPARPASGANSTLPSPAEVSATLAAARREAELKNDPTIFERARDAAMAAAQQAMQKG